MANREWTLDELSDAAMLHVRGCLRNDTQTMLTEKKCELKQSRKHGMGVFATKAMEPWEVITLYPADGVTVYLDTGTDCLLPLRFEGMEDSALRAVYAASYRRLHGHRVEIVGDPTNVSDPFYLGHMINDVCRMTNSKQAKVYQKTSMAGVNAYIGLWPWEANLPPFKWKAKCLVIWAACNIEPGEEIFVTYGVEYWMKMNAYFERHGITASPADRIDLSAMD